MPGQAHEVSEVPWGYHRVILEREKGRRRRRRGSCLWGHGALEAMLRDMHTVLSIWGWFCVGIPAGP